MSTTDVITKARHRAVLARRLGTPPERRRVREEAGVTQADIAASIGVSPQAVSRWENADELPAIEHAERYAEVLDGLREVAGAIA